MIRAAAAAYRLPIEVHGQIAGQLKSLSDVGNYCAAFGSKGAGPPAAIRAAVRQNGLWEKVERSATQAVRCPTADDMRWAYYVNHTSVTTRLNLSRPADSSPGLAAKVVTWLDQALVGAVAMPLRVLYQARGTDEAAQFVRQEVQVLSRSAQRTLYLQQTGAKIAAWCAVAASLLVVPLFLVVTASLIAPSSLYFPVIGGAGLGFPLAAITHKYFTEPNLTARHFYLREEECKIELLSEITRDLQFYADEPDMVRDLIANPDTPCSIFRQMPSM